MHKDDVFYRGLQIRREMFGPQGAEQQTDNATEFTDKMQEMVTRYCFGDIWSREQLDRRTRSMLTIGMLVALGRRPEIKTHVRGAVSNGLTVSEVREVLLHSAIYCGIPAAVDGFGAASEVLAELDADDSGAPPKAGESE